MPELELPAGWALAALPNTISEESVISDGDWVESKDQDPDGPIRLIQLADIGDGTFLDKSSRFMNEEAASRLRCTFLRDHDVLIARMPDPLGRACIFPGVGQEAVTVVDVCLVRLDDNAALQPKILMHWINSPSVRAAIQMQATGTTRKRITRKKLAVLELPIPPFPEQTRIANKLDELLAQVDTIKARVDAIPDILKRFRQSVLAAAVSGELIECGEPEYFVVEDICQVIGGLTKNAKRKEIPTRLPYLRVANVYENELRLDEVIDIGVQEKELKRLLLEVNDLLVVEGNGSLDQIGRVALWDGSISPCVHQNHLIKVRCNIKEVNPKYLLYYLMSPQGKREIVSKATSGAGLYTLSISKISSIKVPLFSTPDQTSIVERVGSLLSFADHIELVVDGAQSRINSITQSILAKAFRGELVPQDSNDEHASALLERIKS